MSEKSLNKKGKSNFKLIIMILSAASLLCALFGNITHFLYYGHRDALLDSSFILGLRFGLPTFSGWIFMLLSIVPCVLLLLYMTVLRNKPIATLIIPVTVGLITIDAIMSLAYDYQGFMFFLMFLCVIAFILATISSLDGFTNRIFILVAAGLGILINLIGGIGFLFDIVYYIKAGWYLYLFTIPVRYFGSIALYAALLLFGLNAKTPAILSINLNKDVVSSIFKK